jgi:hypothetical protein
VKSIDANKNPSPPATTTEAHFLQQQQATAFSTTVAASGMPEFSLAQPTIKNALTAIGLQGVTAENLPKLLPPDIVELALVIMANVRAYFQGIFPPPLSLMHCLFNGSSFFNN